MTTPIPVLYIQHVGVFGGSSRSLLEMVKALPAGSVAPHLVTPRGTVARFAQQQDVPVVETTGITQFDCTRFGHYRGLRWLILLRELWYTPFTFAAMLSARKKWPAVRLVHVNELTALLPIVLAKALFRAPVVAHVRAVMQTTGMPLRRRLLRALVSRFVDRIIAIDETVAASLPVEFRATVIHNGFALDSPFGSGEPATLPPVLSRPGFKAAMIGNLMPMKGVHEFLEAARLCVNKGLAIDFLFVGDNVRSVAGIRGGFMRLMGFARDMKREVHDFIADHGLQGHVHMIGFMANIKDVYDRISVLCFPSHLNAPGRPVFEAAFSGVPSVVALDRPRPDTIEDRVTGLCIRPGNAGELADAIEYLYTRPEERERMGRAARALAHRNFDVRNNARQVLDVYRELVARDPERAAR